MRSSYYNDPEFSYEKYWGNRKYESLSEILAVRRLLPPRLLEKSADIGGGFGRLTHLLSSNSRQVLLIEPSAKQLALAKKHLSSFTNISYRLGTIEATGLPNQSLDLALVIRVLHHLPDPLPAFWELARIIKPGGLLIMEFANSINFKARFKSFLSGQPILPVPVEMRSARNIRRRTIAFVNHHPQAILRCLSLSGFTPLKTLSVSNFRAPFSKRFLPLSVLTFLESISQSTLTKMYFGPSIMILAKRVDTD